MITGSVHIPLPEVEDFYEQERADRHALWTLTACPDGASVIVDIGDRSYLPEGAAHLLNEHDCRLRIEIRGTDPAAVDRFVQAGRTGSWDVVA